LLGCWCPAAAKPGHAKKMISFVRGKAEKLLGRNVPVTGYDDHSFLSAHWNISGIRERPANVSETDLRENFFAKNTIFKWLYPSGDAIYKFIYSDQSYFSISECHVVTPFAHILLTFANICSHLLTIAHN
jgi:hypothetical protein